MDETEYSRLAGQVLEMEKLINDDPKNGAGVLLKNFLSNAKNRMEEILHEEGKFVESKKEQKDKEAATAVLLAERELRLSAAEKEQYAGFMELEYFTKVNFEELEEFYSTGWDKLSEDGKDRMSARVWGGIRRHEYSFDELPEKMRQKESERIYLQLTGAIEPSASLQNVPPQARAEFVHEYEAGNEKATTKILSGDGFSGDAPDPRKSSAVAADDFSQEHKPDEPVRASNPENGSSLKGEGDFALSGVTLCEGDAVITPNVTGAASGRPAQRD